MIVQIIESTLIYIDPEIVTFSPWVYKYAGREYSLVVRGTVHLVNLNRRLQIQFQRTKNRDHCQIHIVPKKEVALILESMALPLIVKSLYLEHSHTKDTTTIIAQTGHLHYPYFNLSHPLTIPLFERYGGSLFSKYSL